MEDGLLDGLDPVCLGEFRVRPEGILAVVGKNIKILVIVGRWLGRECILEIDGLDGVINILL